MSGSGVRVPWWSLVIVGGLAFAGGRALAGSEPETPAGPRSPATPVSTAEGSASASASASRSPALSAEEDATAEAPLRLLERCTARLARANRRAAAATEPEPVVSVKACLDDPAVRAACASLSELPSDEPGGSGGADPEPSSGTSSAPDPKFARAFATTVVGVDDGEARWLETYLCTVHQLRQQMLGDLETLLADDAAPDRVEAVIEEARTQRKDVLADLEQQLGAERYQRLRAVGGLGIMGASLDCTPAP